MSKAEKFISNYTSIEQSKKLLELGMNQNSADMCYPLYGIAKPEGKYPVLKERNVEGNPNINIPCWSVGALIQLLPDTIEDDYKLFIDKTSVSYIRHDTEIGCTYNHKCYLEENLIDAIYKMVCWLLEQKLIKTE